MGRSVSVTSPTWADETGYDVHSRQLLSDVDHAVVVFQPHDGHGVPTGPAETHLVTRVVPAPITDAAVLERLAAALTAAAKIVRETSA